MSVGLWGSILDDMEVPNDIGRSHMISYAKYYNWGLECNCAVVALGRGWIAVKSQAAELTIT